MIEITRQIVGAPDYELGQPRTAPLVFDLTWPEQGEASGLVLVIAGFGADTDDEYSRGLRRHIVETTGMAAVSVRYHAFHARPGNGGEVRVDNMDQVYLVGVAALANAPLKIPTTFVDVVQALAAAKIDVSPKVWLDPAHGEAQNFGVIQALDHLCVIGDLIENAPKFDTRRIVALGSSHGGDIAHMIAKIAPSTLAAVIDNSSYAQPPMNYLAIGETPEFTFPYQGLTLHARVASAWSISDRSAPNFYDRDRDLIRDLRYPPHIDAMRAQSADAGTQYFMINAAEEDTISPPEVKLRQQSHLAAAGFASELSIIGLDDIDGRLFKRLTHGLDCSLKGLFDRYIGRVAPRAVATDGQQGATVVYACVDRAYGFTHSAAAPYVTCDVVELFPDQAAPPAAAAAA